MSQTSSPPAGAELFIRTRVTTEDRRNFLCKLGLAGVLVAVGVVLALGESVAASVVGMILLGLMYTHCVELQHQCLHHSAFLRPKWHRRVGVPLGLPLLVSYSHYRIRHLQHHRFLGTPEDSEFFGFDTRAPLGKWALLKGMFDVRRFWLVLADVQRSVRGSWRYPEGQISGSLRRDVMREYQLIGLLVLAAITCCAFGYWEAVVKLWFVPALISLPLHFLVELPEHIFCEVDSTDVLRNTRSITSGPLATWFTNGNNLHIEHHAAMNVPMNRLRARHPAARRQAKHVSRGYTEFYRMLAREITACKRPDSKA